MSYTLKVLKKNIGYKRDLLIMHNILFLREIKFYLLDVSIDITDIIKYSSSALCCWLYLKKEKFINTFFRSLPDKWSI